MKVNVPQNAFCFFFIFQLSNAEFLTVSAVTFASADVNCDLCSNHGDIRMVHQNVEEFLDGLPDSGSAIKLAWCWYWAVIGVKLNKWYKFRIKHLIGNIYFGCATTCSGSVNSKEGWRCFCGLLLLGNVAEDVAVSWAVLSAEIPCVPVWSTWNQKSNVSCIRIYWNFRVHSFQWKHLFSSRVFFWNFYWNNFHCVCYTGVYLKNCFSQIETFFINSEITTEQWWSLGSQVSPVVVGQS